MPGYDGTGPAGSGPMSGWGHGNCSTSGAYGFRGTSRFFGSGSAHGRGRGFRNMYWQTGRSRWARRGPNPWDPYSRSVVSDKSEIEMLEDEAEALKQDLDAIQERIKNLNRRQE